MATVGTCLTGLKRLRNPKEMNMPLKKRQSDNFTFPEYALLVDGVTETRRLEHSMLERLGITTVPTIDAEEAMNHLRNNNFFNFIIVDFDLPSIIQGTELVRRIRQMGIESKIVAMCSNYTVENVEMIEEAGANCTISKPVNLWVLAQAIAFFRNF